MKFSVSSYSYLNVIKSGEMSLLDCVEKTREIGFDEIEFTDLTPPEGKDIMEWAGILKKACGKAGLGISCYTVGGDFLNCHSLEDEIERLKRQVDVAAELGTKRMRHDAARGWPAEEKQWKGFDDALPVLAKACREVSNYAQSRKIISCVENHGHFCQNSRRIEKLVNSVASPNFGALCDIGNFLCVDESPEEAVARLAPYTVYVHAKDFIVKKGREDNPGKGFFQSLGGNYLRGTIVGHGNVPVRQCLRILANAGYGGTVSIEFEGLEDNITALETGLANLKAYTAAL